MAYFFRASDRVPISNSSVLVEGDSLRVGLSGGFDLSLTNDGDDLAIFPDKDADAGSSYYIIRVTLDARATKSSVKTKVYAIGDQFKTADSFSVEFRFKTTPAHDLVVRDVTAEIYGRAQIALNLADFPIIDKASYVAGDPANVLNFITARPTMRLKLFAAKWGTVERAFWLMLPLNHSVSSLMIAISHTFGQNHAIYSGLGYSNPLSKPLLDFVRDRFVVWRWGGQIVAVRQDMALLMPVRACAGTGGAGELGVFASHAGIGTAIVTRIAMMSDMAAALHSVGVVTYSNGISDANQFASTGGRGLKFTRMVNQDPARGIAIANAPTRKQYLSGYTTGGPRPGFEYMPDARWVRDPQRAAQKAAWHQAYLHDWALPNYTLALALSTS